MLLVCTLLSSCCTSRSTVRATPCTPATQPPHAMIARAATAALLAARSRPQCSCADRVPCAGPPCPALSCTLQDNMDQEEDQEEQEDEDKEDEDEDDKDKDEPDQIPEEFVFEAEVRRL